MNVRFVRQFASPSRAWVGALSCLALGACSIASQAPEESAGGSSVGGAGGSSSGAEGGSGVDIVAGAAGGGGTAGGENPCDAPTAPEDCQLIPSGPACGDGEINQESEQCDDGNSLPGDGCSGICVIEQHFDCPTPGEPCVSTIICGDGDLGPGEACDDGNTADGDGCSAICNLVEPGYVCRVPGELCVRVYLCGDGVRDPNEGCDDGRNDNGDGCDAKCRVELGYKCGGSPSLCTPTVCGDHQREGAESCDDGNTEPFDGCSAICQAEPDCMAGSCTSVCGDGIVLGEACDDGNLRDGDGCSSTCAVEPGHECSEAAFQCDMVGTECTMSVPVIYRDVNASHSDFQPGWDSSGQTGLVAQQLDAAGKPVFSGVAGGSIASTTSFEQWYRNGPSSSTIVDALTLWDNGSGGFVNRWGANGEQWTGYTNIKWCGNGGTGCGSCAAGTFDVCLEPCTPWNNNSECGVDVVKYDGNPLFFPIDSHPDALPDPRFPAKIGPEYGGNWDDEPGMPLHNYHFTTEVHYWFEYDASASARLDFTGDDDVWVFVAGELALDLGGWHPPLSDSVTIDSASAAQYGLTDGHVYRISVFHAERKTDGSSYRLTLSGFNLSPSECLTDCGDGVIALGEACDEGPSGNKGGYNECTPDCGLGPRCGDGIKQTQYGEICDDGVNDGSYGGCAPDCGLGPHCGDAVVQPAHEQCDDGSNDGGYGECAPGCVLGAYCGDGNVNAPYEECDDGANVDGDGCSAACKDEVAVPR